MLVNSNFVTIRSLVVLLFMIGMPAFALMPEGVEGALRGLWPQEEQTSRPAVTPAASDAATFPAPAAPAAGLSGRMQPSLEGAGSSGVRSAHFEVPPTHPEGTVAFAAMPSTTPDYPPASDLPLPSDRLTAPQLGIEPLVNPATSDLEQQLRELGATYYRLESWGQSPPVYRFHCTVTITIGLAEYSRRFEADAESPRQAMQQVRQEVQAWHHRFQDPAVDP